MQNFKYEIIKWLIDIGEIKKSDLGEKQKIFYNVYLGNLNYIKKLDDSRLKVENSEHQNLLMVASKYGKTDIVEYLMEKGFNPKKEKKEDFYMSSIVYAATSGNLQTLKTITKSCKMSDNELYRIICKCMDYPSIDENINGISYLVDLMDNINAADGQEEDNILSEACTMGLYNLSELLIDKGVELNGNVLWGAISGRDISIVQLLIDNNIDVNSKINYIDDEYDQDYYSALNDAIMNGDYDIAKLLVENGAKIDEEVKEYVDDHVSERMKVLVQNNMQD